MSVEILYGLPGSGKGVDLIGRIVRDMKEDWEWERKGHVDESRLPGYFISFDVIVEEFLDAMHRMGCLNYSRCVFVPVEDSRTRRVFWRHRFDYILDCRAETHPDGYKSYKFEGKPRPMRYYIDEMHRDFRARDYQKFSGEATDYFSIHEHLGDKIVGTCQDPEELDSTIRRKTETFTLCMNDARRRAWGFRGARAFRRYDYPGPWPVDGKPSESFSVRPLPKDLVKLYRTGYVDRGVNDKRRGLHVGWLAAGVLVLGVGVYLLSSNVGPLLSKFLAGKTLAKVATTPAGAGKAASVGPAGAATPYSKTVPLSQHNHGALSGEFDTGEKRGVAALAAAAPARDQHKPILNRVRQIGAMLVLETTYGEVEIHGAAFHRDLVRLPGFGWWRVGRPPAFDGWEVFFPDHGQQKQR